MNLKVNQNKHKNNTYKIGNLKKFFKDFTYLIVNHQINNEEIHKY